MIPGSIPLPRWLFLPYIVVMLGIGAWMIRSLDTFGSRLVIAILVLLLVTRRSYQFFFTQQEKPNGTD